MQMCYTGELMVLDWNRPFNRSLSPLQVADYARCRVGYLKSAGLDIPYLL